MRRLVAAILVAAAIAGCSDGGVADGFSADPAPIDPVLVAALGDDVDPAAVPAVQRNFLELCVDGVDDSAADLEPVTRSGLIAVCGCTYDAVVTHLRDSADADTADDRDAAAYDAFVSLERDLRAGLATPSYFDTLVADCIRSEAGL